MSATVKAKQASRNKGKKRQKRTLVEKLRKYEQNAVGYEFIPAMLHVMKRFAANLPDEKLNEVDRRFRRTVAEIPGSEKHIKTLLKRIGGLPEGFLRRICSPQITRMPVDSPVGAEMMANIRRRSLLIDKMPFHLATKKLNLLGPLSSEFASKRLEQAHVDVAVAELQAPRFFFPEIDFEPKSLCAAQDKYLVTFSRLQCDDRGYPDEDNPDGGNPYVVFGAITEEMAENNASAAMALHTPVYKDVDDRDSRPVNGEDNLILYGYGAPQEIDSSVLITFSCFEHDESDIEEITEIVRISLATSASFAARETPGWILWESPRLATAVSMQIDAVADDDQIARTKPLPILEEWADLYAPWSRDIRFDGGDREGVYKVKYRLKRANCQYKVTTVTSDRSNAGTDASVWMKLRGENGSLGGPERLSTPGYDNRERGQTDEHMIWSPHDLGQLQQLEIWHDNRGTAPGWHLKKVIVERVNPYERWQFTFNDWLADGRPNGTRAIIPVDA